MMNWYLVRVYVSEGGIDRTAMISAEAMSPEEALTEVGRFVKLYPIAESMCIYDDSSKRAAAMRLDKEAEARSG